MTKKQGVPVIPEIEETVEVPELDPTPDLLPFPTYPYDLRFVAIGAYEKAKANGLADGDALAVGRRAARRIARETNRRMPE